MSNNEMTPKITDVSFGWFHGKICSWTFDAKVFDTPSKYGIDGGRVSKLGIYDGKKRLEQHNYFAACIVNYDRGWDIRPATDEHREILRRVVAFLEALPS